MKYKYLKQALLFKVGSITELSHVVQERAEGPKAPSPGHRPGYHRILPCALKGQKLYKALKFRK